jgi:cysteinyl-tRNA synthetase
LGGRQREGPKGRGKQDFGPNGHDYDLVADAGPNTSQLSEGEIHSLIAERLQFKLSRDFSNADRIQEQLFSAGVAVHDGMKIWRADGEGFGDIVNDNGKPGRERGSRNDRNRPYEQSPFSLETNDVDAIQALVAQRTEAKMIRNFGLADALRDELREDFNVEVDDRKRLWSVGGDFGGRDNRRAPGPFQLAPWSEAPEDLEEIQRLVQMRDAARADRDFATADDIRDELADRNIFIDDKAREFSLGPNPAVRQSRTQQRQNFVMSALSELPDNAAEIQRLVEMRDAARADRDYATADQIRDELVEDFNVFIDDRSRVSFS